MTSARSRGHRSRSRDAARASMSTSVSTVDDSIDGDGLSAVEAGNCPWSTLSFHSQQLQRIRQSVDLTSALDAEAWSTTIVGVATSTTGCSTRPPPGPFTPQLNRSTELSHGLRLALCCFYSASALLAMQSAVLARGILSVCPSVRHVPVLCPDE